MERKRILKFNLVVFDETVVGDPTKLYKVVGYRDKGAARVCCVREKQLCVQIPFSSNDGRTLPTLGGPTPSARSEQTDSVSLSWLEVQVLLLVVVFIFLFNRLLVL